MTIFLFIFNSRLIPILVFFSHSAKQSLISEFVDWKNFDNNKRQIYVDNITDSLSSIYICDNLKCKLDHANDTDHIYDTLVRVLKEASREFRVIKSNKFKRVPGWNDHCKDKYRIARDAFLVWLRAGRIRSGILYEDMKATRAIFVRALNYSKNNERMIRCEKLALHLKNKNVNQFCKEVRNNSENSRTINDQIDGKKDGVDIAEVFFKKFCAISGS